MKMLNEFDIEQPSDDEYTDDEQKYEEEEEQYYPEFNPRESYDMYDFQKDIMKKTDFDSEEEAIEWFKTHAMRCVRTLPNMKAVIHKNGNGVEIDKYTMLIDYWFNFTFKTTNKKGKQIIDRKSTNLGIFKNDPDFAFRKYQLIPDNDFISNADTINLFPGYEAKMVDKFDQSNIETLLHLIKNAIADKNEEVYEYILNLLAFVIQKPDDPQVFMLMFEPDGGAGKGTFIEFLERYVFGKVNTARYNGLESLLKWNYDLLTKTFVIAEEIACAGSKNFKDINKLNGMITDDLHLDGKFKKPVVVENHHFWVGTTNNRNALGKVKAARRRFFMVEVSQQYIGNKKFWIKVRKDIMNKVCGDTFFTFLMNREVEGFDPRHDMPDTAMKREQEQSAKCSVERYLYDVFNGVWNEPDADGNVFVAYGEVMSKTKKKYVLGVTNEVYKDYKNWCGVGNEYTLNLDVFKGKLLNLGFKWKKTTFGDGSRPERYCITEELKEKRFKYIEAENDDE